MIKKKEQITIYTLGHSTRSIEQFIELLKHYHITHLIDIRTIAKSRHNPQFNEQELSESLKKVEIKYTHLKELGGLRHAHANSINTAWRNASFRGYADYMQTEEFKHALGILIEYAKHGQVAIMCSEAVPWRCHRSLIADALVIRNIIVKDIFSLTSVKLHKLTVWAKVHDHEITYPAKGP